MRKFTFLRKHPFHFLFNSFANDIGIDLGTANTLVWVKGKGIVIREPSVIARHKKTKQVIAIGTEAKKMIGKTPASIITIRPLRGGVIADFDATEAMIAHYIREVHRLHPLLPLSLIRPRIAIGIPSSVTEVERRAVWEAALSAGAREAFLIEEPMAAAIGAQVSVSQPTGVMIVDIGGGTTEIAVISLGGIVVNRSIKVAGDNMDEAIIHYIRLRHGLIIGEKTAEHLKMTIGSAWEKKSKKKGTKATEETEGTKGKKEKRGKKEEEIKESEEQIEPEDVKEKTALVRGRDIETGLPRSIKVTESHIREALTPVLTEIVEAVADIAEEAPPELMTDIFDQGIFLTGGGSNLPGLDKMIVDKTRIPVVLIDDPLTTVVRGTARVLEDPELLQRVKVTGGLR